MMPAVAAKESWNPHPIDRSGATPEREDGQAERVHDLGLTVEKHRHERSSPITVALTTGGCSTTSAKPTSTTPPPRRRSARDAEQGKRGATEEASNATRTGDARTW
jgi:hypothetical protein